MRERGPKSVQEMTKLAEQYMEAHGGSITVTKKQQCTEKPVSRPSAPLIKILPCNKYQAIRIKIVFIAITKGM